MDPDFIYGVVGIVSAVGGAGGAWGAAHMRIKHAEGKLTELEDDLAAHDERTRKVGERLASIETLLQSIDKRLERRDI